MAITQITDHVSRARARLKEQFKDKTNYIAFLDCLTAPAQDIENALWELLVERSIDAAEGVQLDNIGTIVGQLRNGDSDADYRPKLRARIAANTSNGTMFDLIKVAKLVVNDSAVSVVLEPQYPAAIVVNIENVALEADLAAILVDFLKDTKAAGVRLLLEYLTDVEPFTFAVFTALNGSVSIGGTTLTVDSTASFPATGTLILDAGLAVEETVTYTGKTSTTFTGVSALTQNHADNSAVQLDRSEDLGFGDDSVAGGGNFSSVLE